MTVHTRDREAGGYSIYDRVKETAKGLDLDPGIIYQLLKPGKAGYPYIGEGVRYREGKYSDEIEILPEDYEVFVQRLERVAPLVKKKSEYVARVKKLEKELFSEFDKERVVGLEDRSYTYFAPSYAFEKGLLSEDDVEKFKADSSKRMLSLGVGGAHLEQTLQALGVSKAQLLLADIDHRDMPRNFSAMVFDFHEPWPLESKEMFDLIIFPESMGVSMRGRVGNNWEEEPENRKKVFVQLVNQAEKYLKPGGQLRAASRGLLDEQIMEVEALLAPLRIIQNIDDLLILEK